MAPFRTAAENQRNTKGNKKDKSIREKNVINRDMEEADFISSITMKIQEG